VQAEQSEQQYMAVFVQGKRVGYSKKMRQVFADSVVTTELITFSVDAGEGTVDKLSVDETVETPLRELIHFRHEKARGTRLFRLLGRREEGKLNVSLVSDGQKQEHLMDWPENAQMAEGRRLLARDKGLARGTQYAYLQFFSDALSVGEVRVSVLGEKVQVIETREIISLQEKMLEYTVYRNPSRKVIKIIAPSMFMEWITCSESFAMTPLGDD
jgi:hypothetical protein